MSIMICGAHFTGEKMHVDADTSSIDSDAGWMPPPYTPTLYMREGAVYLAKSRYDADEHRDERMEMAQTPLFLLFKQFTRAMPVEKDKFEAYDSSFVVLKSLTYYTPWDKRIKANRGLYGIAQIPLELGVFKGNKYHCQIDSYSWTK